MRKSIVVAVGIGVALIASGCGQQATTKPTHHVVSPTNPVAPTPVQPKVVGIPFSATNYAANGEFFVTCMIGHLTGPCQIDSGSGWGFSLPGADVAQAGVTKGSAVTVNGAPGNASLYQSSAAVSIDGKAIGTTTGAISGGSPSVNLTSLESVVGPAFSVNPATHLIATWNGAPTADQSASYDFALIMGTVVGKPEVLLLDTGSPEAIFMSTTEARTLGLPLGAPHGIRGINGVTVTGYTIHATVQAGTLPALDLSGYTSPDYTGPIILGTAWLEQQFPQGFVIDQTSQEIFALPAATP